MAGCVTIKDVAREAQVSIKTVSNVLNNRGSMRPETRQRVEDTMRRLGYTLNVSARAMKTGGTRLIGLGIFDFSQPFAPYLADIVIDYAKQREYGVIINTYGSGGEGLPTIIDDTYRLGADGWLFFTERPLTHEGEVLRQPYPVVLTGDYLAYGVADAVTMPNIESVASVVGRLIDEGYERIALLGASDGQLSGDAPMRRDCYRLSALGERAIDATLAAKEGTQALRVQGYAKAFVDRGKPVDWRLAITVPLWNQAGGVQAIDALLSGLDIADCPEIIVCLNDAMAFGAMHELQRRGLRVPDDVQVIGFDNVPEGRYSVPSLTTIDPHVEDYARRAVDMLIERIEGYDGPARTYVTDFALVERGSTRL